MTTIWHTTNLDHLRQLRKENPNCWIVTSTIRPGEYHGMAVDTEERAEKEVTRCIEWGHHNIVTKAPDR